MRNTHNINSEDKWENRDLGATESFVRKASAESEKLLDEKLELQMISIRLQKNLVDELKALAGEGGIGYQPYIRQVLTHHVRNEKRNKHLQLIRK
jgi:predicted DNA binding CopG/RHH family protein